MRPQKSEWKLQPRMKSRVYEYALKTIDSHTEGESTRIVYDGFPALHGATMMEKKQDLITLSGNNNLMDQDDFTQLLGGLFHLLDEFSLRGSFEELSESDISHMNDDFARVLILLGTNLAASAEFQRKHFPDFYQKAIGRVKSGEEG